MLFVAIAIENSEYTKQQPKHTKTGVYLAERTDVILKQKWHWNRKLSIVYIRKLIASK